MELTKLIIILVIVLVLIALALSGKLRALCRATLNLFVEDLAATPEGAEALFNQKLDETEEKFRKANTVFQKIAGRRHRCKEEMTELKKKLERIESQCETLAKNNDVEGLDIKIAEREAITEDIRLHEEALVALEKAYKDASEVRKACEENVENLKKQKEHIVSKMKLNRDMKSVYDDLEGIGADDYTSKLLDRVIEKGNDMADIVTGSKEAYESKTSTKARKVDQRLNTSANDAYKQELLKQYGKM